MQCIRYAKDTLCNNARLFSYVFVSLLLSAVNVCSFVIALVSWDDGCLTNDFEIKLTHWLLIGSALNMTAFIVCIIFAWLGTYGVMDITEKIVYAFVIIYAAVWGAIGIVIVVFSDDCCANAVWITSIIQIIINHLCVTIALCILLPIMIIWSVKKRLNPDNAIDMGTI